MPGRTPASPPPPAPRPPLLSTTEEGNADGVAEGDVLGPGRRVRRHVPDDVPQGRHRAVPRARRSRPLPASTAATSSTAGPTAWRSASAASCAPGPARPTRSTSRAPPTTTARRAGRFCPGERYGRVYQINYLRCILCGLCIEACPTRALTMTNEYELADDNRADLIYEKSDLLAPLLPGMEQPPHPMRLGDDEGDYYRGTLRLVATSQEADLGDRLLDPRPGDGGLRARAALRPQGRALRPAAGRRDDQPGGALRRAGRAVPLRGADHRLHRRDLDAVPVRADARRRGRLRLGGRDHPRPAALRRGRRPGLRDHPGRSRSRRSRSAGSPG